MEISDPAKIPPRPIIIVNIFNTELVTARTQSTQTLSTKGKQYSIMIMCQGIVLGFLVVVGALVTSHCHYDGFIVSHECADQDTGESI
jgi:hypothetical protein